MFQSCGHLTSIVHYHPLSPAYTWRQSIISRQQTPLYEVEFRETQGRLYRMRKGIPLKTLKTHKKSFLTIKCSAKIIVSILPAFNMRNLNFVSFGQIVSDMKNNRSDGFMYTWSYVLSAYYTWFDPEIIFKLKIEETENYTDPRGTRQG